MATLLSPWRCAAVEADAPKLVVRDAAGEVHPPEAGPKVVAWGYNGDGQCDVPIAAHGGVVAISAGSAHSVAVIQDGSVVAWGENRYRQTNLPKGLSEVATVAAGGYHTLALKRDHTLVAWGANSEFIVPAGLSSVAGISAGWLHSLALNQDGRVVAWGENPNGQCTVPSGLRDVVAVAAGEDHSVALKRDGGVIAWGWNHYGQTAIPTGLRGVVAIAAGKNHTVALKQDATVVAWGDNWGGQTSVPDGLGNVEAIAAGMYFTAALKRDGTVVTWGAGAIEVLPNLRGVVAIAGGGSHALAIIEAAGDFGNRQLRTEREHHFDLDNTGMIQLAMSIVIEGPDAEQFSLATPLPSAIAVGDSKSLDIRFQPTRLGPLSATLKIYSNDPDSPFVLPLKGTGTFELTATKPHFANSPFTYAPLRLDRQTGLMLQKISFTNTTGIKLEGLKLVLSKIAAGVQIYSSSAGPSPGTYEVIYSNPIAASETISFDLVYFDPKRRTADSINPVIKAEALLEPEPESLPVAGTAVPLRSVRVTPQGPLLEWNSVAGKSYVVEYSNDAGKTWFSAVHRLSTSGTRMFWIDRGQPETKTKPVGVPNRPGGRFYRIKKL